MADCALMNDSTINIVIVVGRLRDIDAECDVDCGRFRYGGGVPAGSRLHGRHSHRHHMSHAGCRLQWIRYLRYASAHSPLRL